MNQIIKRLQSPTPIFFKRLRQITLTIGSIAVVVVAAEKMGWEAPDWVTWILNNYTAIGTLVTAFVSQLATIWNDKDGNPVNDKALT